MRKPSRQELESKLTLLEHERNMLLIAINDCASSRYQYVTSRYRSTQLNGTCQFRLVRGDSTSGIAYVVTTWLQDNCKYPQSRVEEIDSFFNRGWYENWTRELGPKAVNELVKLREEFFKLQQQVAA